MVNSFRYGLRLVSILSLSTACAGELAGDAEAPGREAAEIINGSATTEWPAVPYLALQLGESAGAGCTGSLVSPRVVLAAAHCVDSEPGDPDVTAVTAYFGSTVNGGDDHFLEEIPAEDWIFWPGWSLGGGDFSLILLEHDAPVDPMPYNDTALEQMDLTTSTPLHLVGWGNTVGGNPGSGSGTKREVTVTLDDYNDWVVFYGNNDNGNTCQGDSGGPGFLEIGGEQVVASVTSYGIEGCEGNSGAGRVDVAADWIADYIAANDIPIPPEVSFESPAAGASVPSGFPVNVNATDNTRIERIEIWTGGAKLVDVPTELPPYIVSTPPLPDGPTTLEARAYDNRGDMATATLLVNVCSDGDCDAIDGGLGSPCATNTDCLDGLCGTIGDESLCTAPCADESTCPDDGFECKGAEDTGAGYCWPTDDGGGCGCRATDGASGGGALLLVLAFAFRRRRPGLSRGSRPAR